jgi:hypothetical protein
MDRLPPEEVEVAEDREGGRARRQQLHLILVFAIDLAVAAAEEAVEREEEEEREDGHNIGCRLHRFLRVLGIGRVTSFLRNSVHLSCIYG